MSVFGAKYCTNQNIRDSRAVVKNDGNQTAPVIILVLVQIIVATDDLVESTVLLLLEASQYMDPGAKFGIVLVAAVTSIWLFSCCLVFAGIYYRKCAFLIPHIIVSITLIFIKVVIFIAIVHLSTSWFPLFRLLFSLLIISTTLCYEKPCYNAIKLHNAL